MNFRLGCLALGVVLVACGGTSGPGFGSSDDGGGGGDATADDGGAQGTDGGGPQQGAALVSGLSITDIAVYQAVKVTVVHGGAHVTKNAPLVANRRALVRVFVKPGSSWSSHSVTAYLRLTTGGSTKNYSTKGSPSAASTDANLASTFNFSVEAAELQPDTTFSVIIQDPTGDPNVAGDPGAQYPQDGSFESLEVKSAGSQLKITLFPIKLSNGLTPDTSSSAIQAFRNVIYGLYPIPDVQITVGPTVSYGGSVPQANGSGWSSLLNAMLQKRQNDNPPADVYYYGGFAPGSSFQTFCSGGCVAGLSSLATSPSDTFDRVSIGLVYAGGGGISQATGYTMAHEVGHAHGRSHAPCGQYIQQVDPGFPYSNGGIGVWGWDINSGALIDPAKASDMMGYCQPDWISDYTYQALFDRIKYVNGADMLYPQGLPSPQKYRVVGVQADGTLSFGDTMTVTTKLFGEEHTVKYLASDGSTIRQVTGYYYGYDHIPGGYMLVPEEPSQYARISVGNLMGKSTISLAR